MPKQLAKALCAAAAVLTAAVPAGATHADAMFSEAAPSRSISVPKDKSLSFRLDEPATKIVVAQPDVAEVVATTDRSFYVRGIQPGSTNLLVYGPGGRLMEVLDVRVGFDAALLQADLKTAFPGEDLHVQNLGEGVLLTGTASTNSVATRALALARRFAPEGATSNLLVRASQEVVLEVRIMEATRSALQDVGFSGSIVTRNFTFNYGSGLIGNAPANGVATFVSHAGGVTVNAALQALEEKGVIHTLAKPTLVAVSGGKASFLAGGEFPYPVPQQLGQVTIQFREYGVKLNFEPVVQDNGLIRLQVGPEVSQLDQANAIKINGVQVPGLTTRRADTAVEMSDGDSLAIGGLFQHTYANDVRQFPVLGSIPILGSLFRSAKWNRNETELVIVVTAHVVTADDFKRGRQALVETHEPGPFDFFLNGQALDRPMARDLRGPAAPVSPAPVAAAPVRSAPVALATARPAPVPAAPARAAPVAAAPARLATAASAPVQSSTATSVPVRAAPAPSAPAASATARSTTVASAPVRAAPAPSAPIAAAPVAVAPVAVATVRSAPAASATVRATTVASAPVRAAPAPSAPVASAPVRSAPVAVTPARSAPVASAPTGTAAPVAASVSAAPKPTAMLLRGAIGPMAFSTGK